MLGSVKIAKTSKQAKQHPPHSLRAREWAQLASKLSSPPRSLSPSRQHASRQRCRSVSGGRLGTGGGRRTRPPLPAMSVIWPPTDALLPSFPLFLPTHRPYTWIFGVACVVRRSENKAGAGSGTHRALGLLVFCLDIPPPPPPSPHRSPLWPRLALVRGSGGGNEGRKRGGLFDAPANPLLPFLPQNAGANDVANSMSSSVGAKVCVCGGKARRWRWCL